MTSMLNEILDTKNCATVKPAKVIDMQKVVLSIEIHYVTRMRSLTSAT